MNGWEVGVVLASLAALVCALVTYLAAYRLVQAQQRLSRNELAAAISSVDRLIETQQQASRNEIAAAMSAVDRLTKVISGSQAWFWTPEWQEGEREADVDLAEGRFERFTSLEDMDKRLGEVPLPYASKR